MQTLPTFSRRFAAHLGTASLFALLAAACGAAPGSNELAEGSDPELVDDQASALNGIANYPDSSCTSSQQSKITTAMSAARSTLGSSAMSSCMRSAITSYSDSFPERVLSQMRANMPTNVRCANLSEGVAAEAPVTATNETITIDTGYLSTASAASVAAIILHEVAHNKGYVHPNPDNTSSPLFYASAQEYAYTVPEQIRACSASISAGFSPATPNGPRVDAFDSETTLAPTGLVGGSAFGIGCSGGRVAKGIYGRSGTSIDAFGLRCGPRGGSADTQTVSVGGTGGSAYSIGCAAGEVLIGLHGRANDVNEAVGPICALEPDVLAGRTASRTVAATGGSGGHAYERRCPAKMVVRTIRGKSATRVDRLEVACQLLGSSDDAPRTYLPRAGGTGGSVTILECAGRSALVGLTHHTGSGVDRLGGSCARVDTSCSSGACTESVGSAVHQLPAWGGEGGVVGQRRCADGSVLVGLRMRAATEIDAIGGVCAPAAAWTSAAPSIATTNLPLEGGAGGTLTTRTCPRGELLVGWLIGSATRVDSIQPICRKFI